MPAVDEGQSTTERNKLEPYEEYFLQRSYPDETVDIAAFQKGLQQAKEQGLLKDGTGFEADWTTQGPGNIGARINTIAVHPALPFIIYVGFSRGGVWKTLDGGDNWYPIFDDQLFLAIGDIEIDPQNPNTIYVGTGDPNISGLPFIGGGVYKSVDSGGTWTNIGLTDTRITSRILVDPTDSDKLYVGTMGIPFEPTTDKGLYRSLDGGVTWEQSLFVTDTAGIIDIVINPENPDILYASSWNRLRNNQQSIVHGLDAKVWKTTDGGETWNALTGGLPQGDLGRIGLTMSAQNPDKLYALYVGPDSQLQGIYNTEDGGETWEEINTAGSFEFYENQEDLKDFSLAGFGWYFAKIRIDPNDDNHIFFGGVELWEGNKIDNEFVWQQGTPVWFTYEVHADKHDLVYAPNGDILLATDGGLYRKENGSDTWTDIENIPTSQFYRVAYNPHSPDNYYGGMQDNGTSGGNASNINNWPRIYGGDGFQAIFHPDEPSIMFAETQRGGIVVSQTGGDFFFDATNGIESDDRKNWDMPYMLSHHNPNVLYTGTQRAYQGTLNVPTADVFWSPITGDLTDGNIFGGAAYHSITTLDESHFDEGTVYYGATDGNVWKVDMLSSATENISAGLPDRYVTDVKTSPDLPQTLYVTHSGYKDNENTPRVHRSDDEGATWVDISSDLPDLAVNDIYILPENQDTVIFVATDGGVYGSLNAGINWQRMGTNMPYIPVYDLEWNIAKNELIAGTFARSIMTYPIDSLLAEQIVTPPDTTTVAVNEVLDISKRIKIFPSPATDFIQVEFEKSEPGKTYDLVILNVTGQLVYRTKGTQEGKISQQINVSDLAAGTYFLKVKFRHTIRTGSFVKG